VSVLVEDVRSILAAAGAPDWTAPDLPADLGGPRRTHVWILGEVVVKVDYDPVRAGVLREANALSLLASTDLPVPSLLATGELADGRPWLVMSRLDGELPPDATSPAHELSVPLASQMGSLIARLHSAAEPPGFGNWAKRPTPLAELDAARTSVLAGMAEQLEAVTAPELNRVLEALEQSRPVLATAPTAPVLAHRDVQPRNVLIDQHGRLTGLIDFESAAGGDRLEDFRTLGLDWTATGFQAFRDAYLAAGGALDAEAPDRLAHYVLGRALAIFAYLAPIAPAYLAPARRAVERVISGERPLLS